MDQDLNAFGSTAIISSEWLPLTVAIVLAAGCALFTVYVAWTAWKSRNQPAALPVKTTSPLLGDSNTCTVSGETKKNEAEIDVDAYLETKENNGDEVDVDAYMEKAQRLLAWSGISCTYPATKAGMEDKQTLCEAYGELRAGDVMAIMGPSGGGKSTLMDVLSGRKETGNVTGSLEILGGQTMTNNFIEVGKMLKDITAYVPQENMFFPMQTPEEAVMFVAGLKHGKTSRLEAHRLLNDVGLHDPELYTRPIGGSLAGGFQIRGLSGGEKKRLALACALAMKPRFIMLDEITSGLDSESALIVMQLVRDLCISKGVAAIVVIHQPDGYVFGCFSRLLLVSRGRCVFSGAMSELGAWYDYYCGCKMPESMHEVPLDLMRRLKRLPADDAFPTPASVDLTNNSLQAESQNLEVEFHPRVEVPFHRKFCIVFERNLMNQYVRNLTNLGARLVIYTACSLLDGAIFWQVGDDKGNLSSAVGAFTFVLLMSYLLPFAAISVFVQEKKFFLFEKSLGLYSPWIYCISQTLLESWVLIMAACIEASVVIPMCALWNPDVPKWESFLTILSALMVSGLTGSTLVLFFSMLMPSQDLTFLISSGIVTLSLGLSGGFVPITQIEDFVVWLSWLSPCRYSLQALLIGYTKKEDEHFLELLQYNEPPTVSANIGVLFLMFAILSLGTMLVLGKQREVR